MADSNVCAAAVVPDGYGLTQSGFTPRIRGRIYREPRERCDIARRRGWASDCLTCAGVLAFAAVPSWADRYPASLTRTPGRPMDARQKMHRRAQRAEGAAHSLARQNARLERALREQCDGRAHDAKVLRLTTERLRDGASRARCEAEGLRHDLAEARAQIARLYEDLDAATANARAGAEAVGKLSIALSEERLARAALRAELDDLLERTGGPA